jgi:ferrous iron transport protein A
MTLADIAPGMSFTVEGVRLGGETGKRLADMGFTSDAIGEVIRAGLMRGPMQVRIRGYSLVLRRCEARMIGVKSGGKESA